MSVNTEDKNIESAVVALMKQLKELAPDPHRPNHHGPLFISFDPEADTADNEGLLSTAFELAAAKSLDAARFSKFAKVHAANNNFRIGHGHAITADFNATVESQRLMDAFLRDLPRRMGIERWLAYYQRRLYAARKHASLAAFSLAA